MLGFWMSRFFSKEGGATAIEYGLIASGIAVAIGAGVFTLGGSTSNLFTEASRFFGGGDPETIMTMNFEPGGESIFKWTGGKIVDVLGFGNVLQIDGGDRSRVSPGGETVSTVFDLPAGTKKAVLEFDMTFADSWDGEAGVIYVDGIEVGRGVYNWRDVATWQDGQGAPPNLVLKGAPGVLIEMKKATSSLKTGVGRYNTVGTDYSYGIRIEVADPGKNVSLGFGTTLDSMGKWDESLLIDNVGLSVIK